MLSRKKKIERIKKQIELICFMIRQNVQLQKKYLNSKTLDDMIKRDQASLAQLEHEKEKITAQMKKKQNKEIMDVNEK